MLPPPDVPALDVEAAGRDDDDVLREAVRAVYPVARDDNALREAMRSPDAEARVAAFDRLRREYPRRREFSLTTVRLHGAKPRLAAKLRGVGFRVEPK